MTLVKPASWAWTALGSASPVLAAAAKLLMPAWEGSGSNVKELVSNSNMSMPASVTWATQSGLGVLRFAGTGDGLHAPAPVIGQSTFWTMVAIIRAPSGSDLEVYTEVPAGGSDVSYVEPMFVQSGGATGIIASDSYAVVTDPDELFAQSPQPVGVVDLTGLRIIVVRRSGAVITFVVDGVTLTNDPAIHNDDNIVVPSPTLALIGIGSTDGVTFVWSPLIGDMAFLGVWDTARSDQELASLSSDPFSVVRQASTGGGVGGRPRLAVLCG